MATLTQKLGVKPGDLALLLDATPTAGALVREACSGLATIVEVPAPEERYDLIFFWPRELEGLAARFADLQSAITPDGAVWVVTPRLAVARARGVSWRWEDIQAAALTTDLVDNKNASISDEEYATRFVIRKDRRQAYRV